LEPTSLFGFGFGLRYHQRYWIPFVGTIGLIIVGFAAIVAHASWDRWQELLISTLGSVILVVAHWFNFVEVRNSHTHG
jgi:hypothetical protein